MTSWAERVINLRDSNTQWTKGKGKNGSSKGGKGARPRTPEEEIFFLKNKVSYQAAQLKGKSKGKSKGKGKGSKGEMMNFVNAKGAIYDNHLNAMPAPDPWRCTLCGEDNMNPKHKWCNHCGRPRDYEYEKNLEGIKQQAKQKNNRTRTQKSQKHSGSQRL